MINQAIDNARIQAEEEAYQREKELQGEQEKKSEEAEAELSKANAELDAKRGLALLGLFIVTKFFNLFCRTSIE